MAITTFSEYQAAMAAVGQAERSARDVAEAAQAECRAAAQEAYDASMAVLLAPPPPATAAELATQRAQISAAADRLERDRKTCDDAFEDRLKAITEQVGAQRSQIDREAREGLARLPRMIIAWAELAEVAESLKGVDWTSGTPVDEAPVVLVDTFTALQEVVEYDRFVNLLMLIVSVEDEALVLDGDARTLPELVAALGSTARMHVDDVVYLRGDLVGTAPADTDGFLSMFGAGVVRVEWNQLNAPTLVSLTVTGASQNNVLVRNSWVAVKKRGAQATIVAETGPDNSLDEWKRIRWAGGRPVRGHPNRRTVSLGTSRRSRVEAKLGGASEYVDVWVVWATILMKTSGLRPRNAPKFDPGFRDGTEKLGAVVYEHITAVVVDEAAGVFLDRYHASGKVVAVARLTPEGIGELVRSGWKLRREIQCHDWVEGHKSEEPKAWTGTWVDDTSPDRFLRLEPDAGDKIYDVDAPEIGFGNVSAETYNNFRQWVELNGTRCSDHAHWYWRARWKVNRRPPRQVTLKDVGRGVRQLPEQPHYPAVTARFWRVTTRRAGAAD